MTHAPCESLWLLSREWLFEIVVRLLSEEQMIILTTRASSGIHKRTTEPSASNKLIDMCFLLVNIYSDKEFMYFTRWYCFVVLLWIGEFFMCVCMCVCVFVGFFCSCYLKCVVVVDFVLQHTDRSTWTHTHVRVRVYAYICMCASIIICVYGQFVCIIYRRVT